MCSCGRHAQLPLSNPIGFQSTNFIDYTGHMSQLDFCTSSSAAQSTYNQVGITVKSAKFDSETHEMRWSFEIDVHNEIDNGGPPVIQLVFLWTLQHIALFHEITVQCILLNIGYLKVYVDN